jgi:MscS family membrane protein
MVEFFEREFLDNKVKHYLIVMIIILIIIFIKKWVAKSCANYIFKAFGKSANQITKVDFFNLLVKPIYILIVFFASIVSLDKLTFPKLFIFKVYKTSSVDIVDSFSNGILVSLFIWVCLRLIDFFALILAQKADINDDNSDNQLIVFFKDFFKILISIIGILLILHFSFHKNIGSLLTGLSIVGAAIALATRESLENLIASFIIFFDKPFTTGDTVKVLQFTGTVEKIGLRSTRIRTESKTYISVPNKQMVDSVVDNISLRTQRRGEFKLELSVDNNVDCIKEFVQGVKKVLIEEEKIVQHQVHLTDIGKKYHIVEIEFFVEMTTNLEEFIDLKELVSFRLLNLSSNLGIIFNKMQ